MSDPVVPDGLARSKSGRVPQWVIDEANGMKIEPIPFRPPTSPSVFRGGDEEPRGGRWGRRVLVLAAVVGAVAWGLQSGVVTGPQAVSSLTARRDSAHQPPPGREEHKHPLGTPQPLLVPSDAYTYLMRQDDRTTPVTWSPCRPVHYVVRPDHAPPWGAQAVDDAFARLGAVTGFRFVNDGPTTEGPSSVRRAYQKDRYGDRWAPVLVTWAMASEVPDFGVDIIGEAGPQPVPTTDGDLAYVTGAVSLDAVKLAQLVARHGPVPAQAVILHELGHLMGLGHSPDPAQLMFARNQLGVPDYQAGDLTGLHALSTGPCRKDV